jgi:hypothetical protein
MVVPATEKDNDFLLGCRLNLVHFLTVGSADNHYGEESNGDSAKSASQLSSVFPARYQVEMAPRCPLGAFP